MKKTVLAIILGAVVYFAAGAIEWMVLPWHNSVVKRLPEEILVRDTLNVVVPEAGFYVFPHGQDDQGKNLDRQTFADRFHSGPAGLVVFQPTSGKDVMGVKDLLAAFVQSLAIAGFCFWILSLAKGSFRSYGGKVFLVVMLGVFQWVTAQLAYWNWFYFPVPFILILLLDSVVAFALMGAVMAGFVGEEQ